MGNVIQPTRPPSLTIGSEILSSFSAVDFSPFLIFVCHVLQCEEKKKKSLAARVFPPHRNGIMMTIAIRLCAKTFFLLLLEEK